MAALAAGHRGSSVAVRRAPAPAPPPSAPFALRTLPAPHLAPHTLPSPRNNNTSNAHVAVTGFPPLLPHTPRLPALSADSLGTTLYASFHATPPHLPPLDLPISVRLPFTPAPPSIHCHPFTPAPPSIHCPSIHCRHLEPPSLAAKPDAVQALAHPCTPLHSPHSAHTDPCAPIAPRAPSTRLSTRTSTRHSAADAPYRP